MPLFYPRAQSPFDQPTLLDEFFSSPLKFLMRRVYLLLLKLRGPAYRPLPHQHPIRVVCISDTHTNTPHIPEGDLLIHAGDLTNAGTVDEIQSQLDWLRTLPHKEKVIIAGNHDSFFDVKSRAVKDQGKTLKFGRIHYLRHDSISLTFSDCNNRTLSIYGAPQIPACGGPEFAFQHPRETDTWSGTVPEGTDVLVSHTGPSNHLDLPKAVGDPFLLQELWRVRPLLHCFGHAHCGAGKQAVHWDESQKVYERLAARQGGFFVDLFAVPAMLDLVRMVLHGLSGVLWSRVWGGTWDGGWMVNASLVYADTGKIGNPVQVVEL
ncbi:MAG: hypothetical protein M1814_003388 [Vezdaea aestivalis]|nr:MAG: hypothetical protein M1814_003388 [Vezdaea aestivalis]